MPEKYASQLKKLFFHPKQFFSDVEKDKDYSRIMFFYVKTVVISVIVSLIFSVIFLIKNNSAAGVINTLTSTIISIGFAFVIPFVMAFLTHLGVLILRGKQGYFNTYKAAAYSLAISVIYTIISTIVSSIITLVSPLNTAQLAANPELLLQNSTFLATIIITLVILLVSLIHTLVAQVIGISKFQKITKLRAFFAVILIPLILTIIGLIIFYYLAVNLAVPAA